MRRLFRESGRHDRLEDTGWAPLPPLPAADLMSLRRLAEETQADLVRHAKSSDVGFDELWGNPDLAIRDRVERAIGAAIDAFLRGAFEGFRPVLFNLFVKRARSDRSVVRYHQDFAMIDERGGDAAVQLWIPLVDVSPGNGALVVVEGTHRTASWLRPHDTRHALYEESLDVLPPGAVSPLRTAGHGIAFSNRTVHGSPPNRSGEDRYAVGGVLVPEDASLVHFARRPDGAVEKWAFADADLRALRPGTVPAGARLVEVIG